MVKTDKISTFDVLNYGFFTIFGLLMLYPIWYVLMFSLSDPSHIALNSYYLIPNGFSLESYKQVLGESIVYSGYKNSIIVTGVGTLISLILTGMTAYPLSREQLPGKKLFFMYIMFTMIFHGGMIPTYLIIRSLGLLDSLWALMLPAAINVYNLLIMIKFFKNIPESLIESAKIDGYNDIQILFKIIVPLSTAAFAAVGLFYAVFNWNSFLSGMMYITSNTKWPLQVVLRDLLMQSQSAESGDSRISTETFKMATVIVTILPILMVYPYLQKYFVKGVMLGSVKG